MHIPRRSFISAAACSVVGLGNQSHASTVEEPLESQALPPVPRVPEHGFLFSCKYGMTKGDSLVSRLAEAREAGMDGIDFDAAASVTPQQLREAACRAGVFIHNTINHSHWQHTLTSPQIEVREIARKNLEHCIRCSHAAGGSGVLIVVGKAEDGTEGPDR
ncbi:MAG: hypothetical protein ABGW78_13060, partial [Pirellulales bacterium]